MPLDRAVRNEQFRSRVPTLSVGARRALVVLVCLLVSACGGKGCGGGCASCGTTPLAGGFPKLAAIPNAASVRLTRSGLTFVQENVGTLAATALGEGAKGGIASFAIPQSTQSFASICSVGTPVDGQCAAEIDIARAKLRINAVAPNKLKIDGLLPVRIRDLPVSFKLGLTFKSYVVAGDKTKAPDQNLCGAPLRGATSMPFKEFPLNVELPLIQETRDPRDGYTKIDVDKAVIDIGITKEDIELCDDTCGGACQTITNLIKDFAFTTLIDGVKGQIRTALGGAFCTAPTPTVNPPCPIGSEPNNPELEKATKCVFSGTTECVPSLLGVDGRMDLSKALASVSPGTQGGLDFVLAAAGSMSLAPGEATVPSWTPRSPPVPAEDNNKNGITLPFAGGALPYPQSACVKPAVIPPPVGIPVPKELERDVITPWPSGTPGPHLGLALAGRYLEHAFVGAYNSGLLCMGISTDQVAQLQSGYLSLLAPSISFLTFEQNSAAAAITTKPSKPPTLKIGGGTNIKTDPLLTISLEQLAVDFYVFRLDRFVRLFTYTVDVKVPLNLQTGKDPKTNPKGGILPVIGDLVLTNESVANSEQLFEDPAQLAAGISSLLSGLIGDFLGGGIGPIDVSGALASAGLSIDIPKGGIRKLTSGSDDFVGIFANLSNAAPVAKAMADTRALLLDKSVDASVMSIFTADRARFPRLRVRVSGIASGPTEHTWWIDRGSHAAWTRATELVIDQDTMLLQGKHVLHVASRIVGETASEDESPAEIPFTIDTIAPFVDGKRDGSRVEVKAYDLVSDALVARRRVIREGGAVGPWTEWESFDRKAVFDVDKSADVEIEVRDEEGNVGRVSLPLRGRTDPSLEAAGSGCGCRTSSRASSTGPVIFGIAFALGCFLLRRRTRASR